MVIKFKIDVHGDSIRKTNVAELSSNQEEADTKMFLAVKIAEEIGCTPATIFAVDNDVGILACYFASLVNIQIIVQIGTGRNKTLPDISGNTLDVELIQALPSLHAISCCDSVSAVHGMGKTRQLSTVQNNEEHLQVLADIGASLAIGETIHRAIEKMFCALYGNPKKTNINRLRYQLFCKKNIPEPHKLPPTKDELYQHMRRANYQSYIWKRALRISTDKASPDGNGWCMSTDGCLEVVWSDTATAPESIIELVSCEWRRLKCLKICQCSSLSIECTDMCGCSANCSNLDMESFSSDELVYETEEDSSSHERKICFILYVILKIYSTPLFHYYTFILQFFWSAKYTLLESLPFLNSFVFILMKNNRVNGNFTKKTLEI